MLLARISHLPGQGDAMGQGMGTVTGHRLGLQQVGAASMRQRQYLTLDVINA